MEPRNPYLERLEARAKGAHGKTFEKKGAASLAARLTPASGAMEGAKGDMVKKRKHGQSSFLLEAKSTTAASLPLKLEWLTKITSEALAKGMQPAVLVGFVTPEGKPIPMCESEWVLVPKQVFQELVDG